MKEEKFEKIVNFKPPFDKRNDNPLKNYGIGSLRIWFVLKGKKGAVQILLSTNSYLNKTINEYQKTGRNLFYNENSYDCYDIGYHSPKPMFEGQRRMDCNHLKGGYCFYDGSSLRGKEERIAEKFIEEGEDFIWDYLNNYYHEIFK